MTISMTQCHYVKFHQFTHADVRSIDILIEFMSKLRAENDWIIGMCVAF